jgi:hypothetical protein
MCQPIELRSRDGVERRAFLLAILTEMAFAVAGLFFGIGQGRWMRSDRIEMVTE